MVVTGQWRSGVEVEGRWRNSLMLVGLLRWVSNRLGFKSAIVVDGFAPVVVDGLRWPWLWLLIASVLLCVARG